MKTILLKHLSYEFKGLLEMVLLRTKGNQVQAALYLGISRGSLRYYIKQFNLEKSGRKSL